MIVLDADHVSILRMPPSVRQSRLVERMSNARQERFSTPVMVVEVTMRGWLAAIANKRRVQRHIPTDRELNRLFECFAAFPVVPFDQSAVDRFESRLTEKVRIVTRDLKIAGIRWPTTLAC